MTPQLTIKNLIINGSKNFIKLTAQDNFGME